MGDCFLSSVNFEDVLVFVLEWNACLPRPLGAEAQCHFPSWAHALGYGCVCDVCEQGREGSLVDRGASMSGDTALGEGHFL